MKNIKKKKTHFRQKEIKSTETVHSSKATRFEIKPDEYFSPPYSLTWILQSRNLSTNQKKKRTEEQDPKNSFLISKTCSNV